VLLSAGPDSGFSNPSRRDKKSRAVPTPGFRFLLFSICLHDSDQSRDFPWWRSGGGVRVHKVKSLTQMLMNRRVDAPELQRQSSLLAFHDVAYPSPIVAIPLIDVLFVLQPAVSMQSSAPENPSVVFWSYLQASRKRVDDSISGSIEMQHRRIQSSRSSDGDSLMETTSQYL
ncbi:uncharacterized protein CLUP02_16273, partial [Colletotrichum lupini]